jgi:hypothetical protein
LPPPSSRRWSTACSTAHRGIVGAQPERRRDEAQAVLGGQPLQRAPDHAVRTDPLDTPARARWPLDPAAEAVRGAGVKA